MKMTCLLSPQAKWNGPLAGEILGSIGEDRKLKLWKEDVLEPPNHGNGDPSSKNASSRFKQIYVFQTAEVPFMSLDFKNLDNETYLAAIARDGQLTVYEPMDHDRLGEEWRVMWQDFLCRTPARTEETGFRVCWHHEKLPAWPAILAGLDRRSLSLAVSVGDTVKVFRTDKDRKFFTAAELTGARGKGLVRDVAWANGSMRGFDVIATASKDGFIRVYELHTPNASDLPTNTLEDSSHSTVPKGRDAAHMQPSKSGIGAGLAVGSRGGNNEEDGTPGKVTQEVKFVKELQAHEGAVWRVGFSFHGDLLISTGDDGLVQVWKKDINSQWIQYAEIDATKDP